MTTPGPELSATAVLPRALAPSTAIAGYALRAAVALGSGWSILRPPASLSVHLLAPDRVATDCRLSLAYVFSDDPALEPQPNATDLVLIASLPPQSRLTSVRFGASLQFALPAALEPPSAAVEIRELFLPELLRELAAASRERDAFDEDLVNAWLAESEPLRCRVCEAPLEPRRMPGAVDYVPCTLHPRAGVRLALARVRSLREVVAAQQTPGGE